MSGIMATKTDKKELDEIMSASETVNLGLLSASFHYLGNDIDEDSVSEAIRWIIYENLKPEPQKTLTLMINSVGGDLSQAFALIDVMKNSHHPIRTIGVGSVISAAFLIFASGTRGERFIARNTSIMCHQYSSSSEGKHHDIKAYSKEMEFTNKRMINILKEATDLDLKTIRSKLLPPTDVWMTPADLITFGIADNYLNYT
jgi:ATP-dependent Clp protease, protease subunit